MSLYYRHTLIAIPKDFVSSGAQVQDFLSEVVGMGVVPGPPRLDGQMPSGKTRTVMNPFTFQEDIREIMTPLKIEGVNDVSAIINGLREYFVGASGFGQPTIAPIPLKFDEPYHLEVRCLVFADLHSTSDLHEESNSVSEAIPYGEMCPMALERGLFSNPHDLKVIEVADAGCVRFWIEFEFGKFLFPKIEGDNLSLLNPVIVETAVRTFGIAFVQGCWWG